MYLHSFLTSKSECYDRYTEIQQMGLILGCLDDYATPLSVQAAGLMLHRDTDLENCSSNFGGSLLELC
jgi:hypothetical protein